MRDATFIWRDGERTIHFGPDVLEGAAGILGGDGWGRWALLSTPRALEGAPESLTGAAAEVHEVDPGPVNELSAALMDQIGTTDLVALGGGRVIDTAKAVAAVRGGRVAAIPTTLSGAEMTAIHKVPDGHSVESLVRPSLIFANPDLMTAQDEQPRRASAMNALAHGADSLYTPLAHPLSRMSALEGARLVAAGLDEPANTRDLALGSLLSGYAIDSALFSLHHVICQSLVRVLRIPHAETNAAILPVAMRALAPRAPEEIEAFAVALGTYADSLEERIHELAGGRRALGDIGADREDLDAALDAIEGRSELSMTPDAPDREELRRIIESAW